MGCMNTILFAMIRCTIQIRRVAYAAAGAGGTQSDFSFYFDTGSRRCYIAPERFYDPPGRTPPPAAPSPRGAPPSRPRYLTPEMDVFSAGCVLAELFTDGKTLFDLSQVRGLSTRMQALVERQASRLAALKYMFHLLCFIRSN